MSRPLILAVEDEEGVRNLLAGALPVYGLDVVVASSGAEALDVYRGRSAEIAAVVLDEMLPDMRGLEVFRHMRRANPGLRACFVTGWGSSFPGDPASHSPVIRKPFTVADLAATLHELVGASLV